MSRYKGAYSEYAIAAFVRAAELGYPSLEEIKSISTSKPIREDLRAVHNTFEELCRVGRKDYVSAVMAIYKPCAGGDRVQRLLHDRVVAYSVHCAYSEETVYRMLSRTRRIFAKKRGLTVE